MGTVVCLDDSATRAGLADRQGRTRTDSTRIGYEAAKPALHQTPMDDQKVWRIPKRRLRSILLSVGLTYGGVSCDMSRVTGRGRFSSYINLRNEFEV